MFKKSLALILALLMILCSFAACQKGGKDEELAHIEGLELIHELEFGGIYLKMTIDEFNALGFEYGDSVDVEFSNGKSYTGIPYYNGYYVDPGEILLVAYPGYDYIKLCINCGNDIWDEIDPVLLLEGSLSKPKNSLWSEANIGNDTTASVKVNTKGTYKDIQNARDIHYSDDRSEFPSDEAFANFRAVNVGSLKENTLYRSASPCDNQHNRAPYVDKFIKEAGVMFVLDLADNESKINRYIAKDDFDSPYLLSLYESGKVVPVALNMNYFSDEFKSKVAEGLRSMAASNGPYLVHCTEGKDRTGFVCFLLEAFAGAGYEEIKDDYMITYDNYYEIRKDNQADKYEVIVDSVLSYFFKLITAGADVDYKNIDLAPYAEKYMLDAGMTQDEISALKIRILK